jgi:hypothetical protein
MALPNNSFSGPTFFSGIRSMMDADRGFFAASDDNLRYACMDAAFYRYEIFERPSGSKFTTAAAGLPSQIRVVANGQFYGEPHCTAAPCVKLPQGEVIIAHVVKPGNPPKAPDYRHLGQWDGRSTDAFQMVRGDPSGTTTPTTYNHAMGTLLPVIQRGIPFKAKEVRDGSGNLLQGASPGIGSLLPYPGWCGFTIYGIHRATQILFVLTQQHVIGTMSGYKLGELIDLLDGMGVDDAVLADSGTSSMMLVDGVVETTPGPDRDNTMPKGGMFRLQTLGLASGAKLTANADSTDTRFPPGTVLTGATGTVGLTTPGSAVDLMALGSGGSYASSAALLSALGISPPIHLESPRSNLVPARPFAEVQSPQRVSASLKIAGTKTSAGMTGTLTVLSVAGDVSSPKAVFDVDWPLTA